jgi:hypothetical protein
MKHTQEDVKNLNQLEETYTAETGQYPRRPTTDGYEYFSHGYAHWLERRDTQREALLAQRTAERADMLDALIQIWTEWPESDNAQDPEADGYATLQAVKNIIERATGQRVEEILQEARP